MNTIEIKNVLEAALLCSSEPLSMTQLRKLFNDEFNAELLRPLLDELALDWSDRSVELAAVASGWRFQSKPQYAMFINRLTPEKAPKYSRAVMETLAIIAYRQPVTRGDIEEIRGVSVGSQIVKTLEDRGWIDVIGHKEVPGRPALFATTKQFLDDLNLLSIKELPPIDEMGGEESADFFDQQVAQALEESGGSEASGKDDTGLDHAESSAAREPAGDGGGDGAGPDAANDQDGADLPGTQASLATDKPALEIDVAGSQPHVASDRAIQAHEEEPHEIPNAADAAALTAESVSDPIITAESESTSESTSDLAPVDAADGEFLAAAAAEAVAALEDGGEVVGDGATADAPVAESTRVAPADADPVRSLPGVLKPSGPAVDDPNLEQVDWPDLPSLDGLDSAAQESTEQTSEQDPPGGESEPVESR